MHKLHLLLLATMPLATACSAPRDPPPVTAAAPAPAPAPTPAAAPAPAPAPVSVQLPPTLTVEAPSPAAPAPSADAVAPTPTRRTFTADDPLVAPLFEQGRTFAFAVEAWSGMDIGDESGEYDHSEASGKAACWVHSVVARDDALLADLRCDVAIGKKRLDEWLFMFPSRLRFALDRRGLHFSPILEEGYGMETLAEMRRTPVVLPLPAAATERATYGGPDDDDFGFVYFAAQGEDGSWCATIDPPDVAGPEQQFCFDRRRGLARLSFSTDYSGLTMTLTSTHMSPSIDEVLQLARASTLKCGTHALDESRLERVPARDLSGCFAKSEAAWTCDVALVDAQTTCRLKVRAVRDGYVIDSAVERNTRPK